MCGPLISTSNLGSNVPNRTSAEVVKYRNVRVMPFGSRLAGTVTPSAVIALTSLARVRTAARDSRLIPDSSRASAASCSSLVRPATTDEIVLSSSIFALSDSVRSRLRLSTASTASSTSSAHGSRTSVEMVFLNFGSRMKRTAAAIRAVPRLARIDGQTPCHCSQRSPAGALRVTSTPTIPDEITAFLLVLYSLASRFTAPEYRQLWHPSHQGIVR